MVLLAIHGPAFCQLLDQAGRPIGTVYQPVSDQIIGPGAGTVLLTRNPTPEGVGKQATLSRLQVCLGMNWH